MSGAAVSNNADICGLIDGVKFMIRYHKRIFDIAGIAFLSLVLAVIVWLSSDSHIYFSKDSGYYDAAFFLKIHGGSGALKRNIYYTLDGSEPTQDDYLYDKKNPIWIEDATDHENVYAARTDVGCGGFEAGSASEVPYQAPDYLIDKCNVVRAAIFDKDGNCVESITGIYFVGFQDKKGYEGLYTASIVTDPANLFDEEKGIYVEGVDEDSNYRERGMDWEREMELTIFDGEQREILTEKGGIRIKGGSTRSLAQKSVRCYARKKYSGDNRFHVELFHKGYFPHRITFYAGGNDYCYKVKDPMVHELAEGMDFATMRFIPCVLFLDGEYWGVYYISEDYDDDFISDHYDVEKEDVVMIKSGQLKEGEGTDYDDYLAMRQFMVQEDMTLPENYAQAGQMMDMGSYIDYYALQMYLQRHGDWPSSNYALWKTRVDEGSEYGDGRWRWMLYDVNSAGMDAIVYDSLAEVLHDDEMFYSLYQNEEFRRQFAERILYIGREILNAEKCSEYLDAYGKIMKISLLESNRRFYLTMDAEDFDSNREWMAAFFEQRQDAVWDFLVDNMGEEWLRQNGIQK